MTDEEIFDLIKQSLKHERNVAAGIKDYEWAKKLQQIIVMIAQDCFEIVKEYKPGD